MPNQDDRRKPDQNDNRRLRRSEADVHLYPQNERQRDKRVYAQKG